MISVPDVKPLCFSVLLSVQLTIPASHLYPIHIHVSKYLYGKSALFQILTVNFTSDRIYNCAFGYVLQMLRSRR